MGRSGWVVGWWGGEGGQRARVLVIVRVWVGGWVGGWVWQGFRLPTRYNPSLAVWVLSSTTHESPLQASTNAPHRAHHQLQGRDGEGEGRHRECVSVVVRAWSIRVCGCGHT
jgi:hypothetical protein